jgi:hypothetical protein
LLASPYLRTQSTKELVLDVREQVGEEAPSPPRAPSLRAAEERRPMANVGVLQEAGEWIVEETLLHCHGYTPKAAKGLPLEPGAPKMLPPRSPRYWRKDARGSAPWNLSKMRWA